ncbi:MAG: hypothetical protein ABIK21_06755 [bacterium]
MKKIGSISMIILVVLAAGLAGCGTTPSPTPPEMVNLESPLYIITGENNVGGFMNFCEEVESFYGPIGLLGGYPLVEGIEKYLENIRECNSILIIPPAHGGIQEFRDLENEYPDLCPLSCDELESELESHSSPLLYFSQDLQADKIRGIIVADQVNALLAELLSAEDIPLDVPFRYENEQLQILE